MPATYSNPEIIRVLPANGEVDVALNGTIRVTFSVSMAFSENEHADLGRVTDSRIFYVTRQVGNEQVNVPGSIVYDSINKIATFTPASPLTSGGVYRVVIVGEDANSTLCAQDIRGNKLKFTGISVFTAAASAVNVPSLLYPVDKESVSGVMTFSWTQVDNNTAYTFEISPANDFVLVVFTVEDTFQVENSVISYTPNYAFTEGRYYWRVKQAGGVYSNPSQFFFEESSATQEPSEDPSNTKPYVISSYPKDKSAEAVPSAIKLKFSSSIESLDIEYGTDVFLLNGIFDERDIPDMDIIPLDSVAATITAAGAIITITPTSSIEYGKEYSVVTTGDLTNGIITFVTPYEYIRFYMDEIRKTLSKYLNVEDSEIYYQANRAAEEADTILKATYEETSDETYNIDITEPPGNVIDYIIYSAEYNLLLQLYINMTSGSDTKILADFQVTKSVRPSELLKMLDYLAKKIAELKAWMEGTNLDPRSIRPKWMQFKGTDMEQSEGYPDFMTNRSSSFFETTRTNE